MSWFSSTADIDSEDDESDDEISEVELVLSEPVATVGNTRYYKSSARDLIHIPIWTYQRCMDPQHVEVLSQHFKERFHSIGTIKALITSDDDIRIIDGQHRLAAWRNIMKSDASWNSQVLLEVYEVESLDSRKAFDLFKQVNNVKNLRVDDLPSETTRRILERIMKKWPGSLKRVGEGKRVNRPKICNRKLYNKIKDYLKDSKLGEDEFWEGMLEMNRARGLWSCNRFRCSKATMEKARELGFYLGMESELSWIDQVY